MALHDYGMHCERCGARLTLRESSNGGLCTTCLERAALEDDEKRPPECGNVRRFNMVADDLGRWVRWEEYCAHVYWLAKRLEEATGIYKGAWLEKMRKEACRAGSGDA